MATVKRRGKTYLIRVYAGYDAEGRQVERTKTWTPPAGLTGKAAEKEAQIQAALFEDQIRNGIEAKKKVKIAEFGELWFTQYAEKQLRRRTIAGYRDLWQQINRALGHMALEKLRPYHIIDFYGSLTERDQGGRCTPTLDIKRAIKVKGMTKAAFAEASGVGLSTLGTVFQGKSVSFETARKIANGLGLPMENCFNQGETRQISAATVKKYHQLLHKMLEDAVRWQYVSYNPCTRVVPPKALPPEVSCLDDKQAVRLLELLAKEDVMYSRPVFLLFLTGMRRGELMGLEWKDVNWTERTIRVCRTSQYLAGQGIFTDRTKNKSSERQIAIPEAAIEVLRGQQQWQSRQKNIMKERWIVTDRVVTMEDGRAMRPDRLTHWFTRFVRRADLPPIHLHSIRHTYATLCIADNIPLTAVAAQLGHANVWTTAKIYAHSIQTAEASAALKIGERFDAATKTTDK